MKFLVVDVGNTSTAVGLWSDGRVSCVSHDDDGFSAAAPRADAILENSRVDGMAYLSVVPRADAAWESFASSHGLRLFVVSHECFTNAQEGGDGIRLDYPQPETIGADRLADAAGAVDRYGAPVMVCDFGTAFTTAVVTGDRIWRGGVIAPGFPLMRDYLYERTAKLPRMKLGGPCPRIGKSTEAAMRFGAIVGYRGMVREIVLQLSDNFKTKFRLVATGGFAKWALMGSGMDFTIDPTLTLHGAGLLASREMKAKIEKGII